MIDERLHALVLSVEHHEVEQCGAVVGLCVQHSGHAALVVDEGGQDVGVAELASHVDGGATLETKKRNDTIMQIRKKAL